VVADVCIEKLREVFPTASDAVLAPFRERVANAVEAHETHFPGQPPEWHMERAIDGLINDLKERTAVAECRSGNVWPASLKRSSSESTPT
jgi:hypothetical protein